MHVIFWPFFGFWWLIFPLGWMVVCVIRTMMRDNFERERLRILKSYADQGKDIPETLRRELFR